MRKVRGVSCYINGKVILLKRKNTYGVRYNRAEEMPLIELGSDESSAPKPEKVPTTFT